MIGDVVIENFKSITKLELSLGRINVFIGANGCGKSNILEAIALCSAAAETDSVDLKSFLFPRGVRVPDNANLLFPAFVTDAEPEIIVKAIPQTSDQDGPNRQLAFACRLELDTSTSHAGLKNLTGPFFAEEDILQYLADNQELAGAATNQVIYFARLLNDPNLRAWLSNKKPVRLGHIWNFLIYSPEYRVLRNFDEEGQKEPLGIHGEGLFKLLSVLETSPRPFGAHYDPLTLGGPSFHDEAIRELKDQLRLIDWFEDFYFNPTTAYGDRSLLLKDKYFDPELAEMSQRSANEGFLFLLFYFTLFISDRTPKFFAIDNVDASLNPKLCARLMVQLNELAKKHDKQAIFTTHNPAILDGLNLDDDEQRLFVVYRNRRGHTTAKRVQKPQPLPGQAPVKLSEAFTRGYIGGLPSNF